MKVICINNINDNGDRMQIVVGEIYTASQCPVYPNRYDIAECLRNPKTGNLVSYQKSYFIPLSDIDETELVREKLETIKTLDNE